MSVPGGGEGVRGDDMVVIDITMDLEDDGLAPHDPLEGQPCQEEEDNSTPGGVAQEEGDTSKAQVPYVNTQHYPQDFSLSRSLAEVSPPLS